MLELLPRAGTATQTRLYAALINFSLFQGDYASATHAFESAAAGGVLPQRATAHLFASLPPNANADRDRIFGTAVDHNQLHPDTEQYRWTLPDLVARFYTQLPSALVLKAIDTVHTQAEQQDKRLPGGTIGMGSGENNISFHSAFDFQLFAVAPALQHFDSARAKKLLAHHPDAADSLRRFPKGLPSFDPDGFHPNRNLIIPTRRKPIGLQFYNRAEEGQNLSSLDMGLEFTVPCDLSIIGVTGSLMLYANPNDPEASILDKGNMCPSDVPHRLELARTVPIQRKVPTSCGGPYGVWCSYADTFPRARLIQVIAERCTYYPNPPAAQAALREQMELLAQMPAEHRIDYFATAADLYLRLSDRKGAAAAVRRGFEAARVTYDVELASTELQKFPKGVWFVAEAYRRMIALGVNSSLDDTRKAIDEIPYEGLRELEQVMIARALLGVPVRRYIVVGPGGGNLIGDIDVTYDQF